MTKGRRERIKEARIWLASRHFKSEDEILLAYKKNFRVNGVCTRRDLYAAGILSPEKKAEFEKSLENRAIQQKQKNEQLKKKKELKKLGYDPEDQDENFAFIAGYTSGGFPYGITWEEQDEFERQEAEVKKIPGSARADDEEEELPF